MPKPGLDPNASFRRPVEPEGEVLIMIEANVLEKLLKKWYDAGIGLEAADELKWRITAARKAQDAHRGPVTDTGGTAEDHDAE